MSSSKDPVFLTADPGGGGSSFFVNGCSTAARPSGVQSGNGSVTIKCVP